ncbi:type IV secretory system conjugative DNA transfer family protein [Desulfitobacterium hafniense]|uniref:type IV secretory system conjugative DNA transfer family protein n=1 Tax=Desulfitobacterium hafniense TaxID=49338 RepID=UPI00037A64ED|nr:TraM recognition domain-containing protein [Desulfitobacterium hafniense]
MSRLLWGGDDPFTHTIIVGPTRCGKTATLIKPIIYQILMAKARGFQCGLSVIEPKGDVAQFTADLARELGIPGTYHFDPTLDNTDMINLMKGPVDDVAEATIAVLKGMMKQDEFFALMQELTARNFIKLLKLNHEDNLDIISVLRSLRNDDILKQETTRLEKSGKDPELLGFFEHEMRGRLGEKWKELAVGLRAQIEKLVSNSYIRRIITGDTGIDLDRHMMEGGVLAVNSCLKFRSSGDAFGQFLMMHLQSAAFRRPGTERTRVPHFLIIDEMSRYINPDIERFLSIAAEYRVASVFAVQSFEQLAIASGNLTAQAMKTSILTNCRNKITFGGISSTDASFLAEELGKDWVVRKMETYDGKMIAHLLPESYRQIEQEEYRIRPTDMQDGLPRFYFVHKLIRDGHPMKPGIAIGQFVPNDWRYQARQLIISHPPTPQQRGVFSLRKILKQCGLSIAKREEETNARSHKVEPIISTGGDEVSKIKILVKTKPGFIESCQENQKGEIETKEMPIEQEIPEEPMILTETQEFLEELSEHAKKLESKEYRTESLRDMNDNFM